VALVDSRLRGNDGALEMFSGSRRRIYCKVSYKINSNINIH
jgi:hypothetical protein